MSDAARRKMSESKKGMYDGEKNPMYGVHLPCSEEKKKRLSERFSGENNPMYGVHLKMSEQQRAKQSAMFTGENNPFYGKKHTEETRFRMSAAKKKTPVICVETGVTYESVNEAARQTGIHSGTISRACKKPNSYAGGFHWQYIV